MRARYARKCERGGSTVHAVKRMSERRDKLEIFG